MSPSIQADIKQSKPFSTLEEETAVALARTSDQLARRFDALLRQHGLTGTQYNVLRILRGAGKPGLPCSEIGERMISRDPDITRLLDRMERAGLCTRARDQKDRRVILVRISDQGLKTVNELDKPVTELNREVLGHMGKGRLRTLLGLLEAVRNG